MRKFILKLCYLLVPLVFLSYPLDLIFSDVLKESHGALGEYEVWNAIYDANIDCDLAIYGSSRAWVQIDPEIMEAVLDKKVYNFGMDGHNFQLQYLRHLEYIKYNKKPSHIVLNVDVFTLQKREDLYQQNQFLPYMLWNKNMRSYTSNYEGFSKSDYYIPFLRYIGKGEVFKEVKTRIFNTKNDTILFRKNGYRGFDKKWETSVDSVLASEEKYTINFHENTIQLFEQFITECIANDIRITLVYAPEYIAGQQFVSNREEAINYFRSFSKKYKLTFLDYSQHELSFKKDQFYNASHLNKEGAQLFTRKLAEDLKDIIN